mmetsp:Transcript_22180/g.69192  ORF Transcript_22180/g.69192 Transcript_22180/m.69192 type:complete len:227 (+) Transcript_22180:459-1139(+)
MGAPWHLTARSAGYRGRVLSVRQCRHHFAHCCMQHRWAHLSWHQWPDWHARARRPQHHRRRGLERRRSTREGADEPRAPRLAAREAPTLAPEAGFSYFLPSPEARAPRLAERGSHGRRRRRHAGRRRRAGLNEWHGRSAGRHARLLGVRGLRPVRLCLPLLLTFAVLLRQMRRRLPADHVRCWLLHARGRRCAPARRGALPLGRPLLRTPVRRALSCRSAGSRRHR